MRRKLILTSIALVLISVLCSATFADIVVGVKSGNWIEYKSSFTGQPESGHNLSSARMDILDVSDSSIFIQITSRYPNGSSTASNATLNLQTGHLIDAFIIPSGLNAGDKFYDETLGNVTITKAEQHVYAGATRTVLYGAASGATFNDTYVWDQATGVCVEGFSEDSQSTIHSIVDTTNMWQPMGLSVDFIAFLAAVAVIIALLVVALVLRFKRSRTPKAAIK